MSNLMPNQAAPTRRQIAGQGAAAQAGVEASFPFYPVPFADEGVEASIWPYFPFADEGVEASWAYFAIPFADEGVEASVNLWVFPFADEGVEASFWPTGFPFADEG